MADLKKTLEEMGLENVRAVLASGNIIFEAGESDEKMLTGKIVTELKKTYKKDINVILRSLADLKELQSAEPFRDIRVTPDTRLYVTFVPEKASPRTIPIPYASGRDEFRILRVGPREVFSVVDLSKGKGTPEAMSILEKEFGSDVTTRNWNTILKILEQN